MEKIPEKKGFLDKINEISIDLIALKEKLETVAFDFLSSEEKAEYSKIMELIDFYIASIVELVMENNKNFIVENKEFVKSLIKNIENFIITVNNNLNI